MMFDVGAVLGGIWGRRHSASTGAVEGLNTTGGTVTPLRGPCDGPLGNSGVIQGVPPEHSAAGINLHPLYTTAGG